MEETLQKFTGDPRIIFYSLLIVGSLIRYAIYKLKKVESNQGKLFDEHKAINLKLTKLITEHKIYCKRCNDD